MKKIFTLVLLLSVVVALALTAFSVGQTARAEEITPTTYFIETEEEFLDFHQKLIRGECGNDTYILTSDIYLDRLYAGGKKLGVPTSLAEPGETEIGYFGFNGTFDGRGHAIVGLKEPFAYIIGENGRVKDLQLIDASGVNYALALLNNGVIDGVEVTGNTNYSALVYNNNGLIERSLAVVNFTKDDATNPLFYKGLGEVNDSLAYGIKGGTAYAYGSSDYFDLDGKSNSYAELNYNLLTTKTKDLTTSLNLYNAPFVGVEENTDLGEYLDENGSNEFFNGEKLTYNLEKGGRIYSVNASAPTEIAPSGAGTKENPYQIGSIENLLWLGNLQVSEYAMLTKNLVLDGYDYGELIGIVESFSGNFDGNGKSITLGATDIPLFNVIESSATVTDLMIVGDMANDNYGAIYSVYAKGAREFVTNNFGPIFRADVKGETFVANAKAESVVAYVRCDGEYFIKGENLGYAEDAEYTGAEKPTGINDSWAFGGDATEGYEPYGWAYLKGVLEDTPVLVFPSDRVEYKNIISIADKKGQEKYAKINGYASYELRTLPVGAETGAYGKFDDGSNANLFLGANGAIYELLQGQSGGNTVANVNDIITSGLSLAVKNYLATKELKWEVKEIGGDSYAPFTESHFDPASYPNCVFHLKWSDEVVYLEAYLTISDKVTVEYAYINKGVTLNNFISALDLINYYNGRLADLGLSYADTEVRLLDKNQNEISLASGFVPLENDYFNGANYYVEVTTPSNLDYSATTTMHSVTLTKGQMDYSAFAIASKIGGETPENAVIYDENGISTPDDNFSFLGYDFCSLTLLEVVSRLDKDGYLRVGLDGIKDVGEYTLKLGAYQEYFESAEIEVSFFVTRKEIEVFVKYAGEEVINFTYFDAIDESKLTYHLASGDEITTLKEGGYTTTYTQGSNVTSGENYYTLSFLAPESEDANPNYIINESARFIKIYVAPRTLTTVGVYESESLVFDAKEHTINFNGALFGKHPLDGKPLEYSVEYEYNGKTSSTPFYFVDSGEYDLTASVTLSGANYVCSPLSATLTILKKSVNLSVDDVCVNYGETPLYTATVTARDGVEIEGGYAEYINYTLTSAYEVGVTKAGSTLPITLTLLDYEDQGEYKNIGSLSVYVIKEQGLLTVGKKTYALDMRDTYEYTARGVELDFKGEEITFSDGYPKFKYQTGGVAYDFQGGVPSAACDSTFIYIACLKIDESDEYYGTMDKTKYPTADANGVITKTFTIYKKSIPVSGLYVFDGDLKTPLVDGISLVYDGDNVKIDVDRSEFAGGGDVTFYFRYRYLDSEEYVESSTPIMLKDATRIRDISLTIDGGSNYEVWTSGVVINLFEIKPRLVKLQNLTPLTYKGYAYTLEVLKNRVNALSYEVGYEPIGADTVTYSLSILGGLTEIALPGTYTLLPVSLNPNYTLGDDFRLGQTINTSRASIDLSGIDFGSFEYGVLNAQEAYIEKEMEFSLDNEETLTQTIKFFIDYNSSYQFSSLAPGSYNVTRAESKSAIINGEMTDLIAFEVVNGASKVVVKPVEIAFDYLNMLEVGSGIKPTYVYGDEALKSLPTSVVRKMTWAVSTGTTSYSEIPQIVVSTETTPKHVGTYTFTAKANYQTRNDQGELVDCFKIKEDLTTYTVVVEKRQVRYEVTPVTIYVGDSLPTFSVRFPISSYAPLIGDTLGYEFIVDGFDNTTEGEYAVIVKAKLNEGGAYYEDYELVKVDASAKELRVVYREFDDSLSATGRTEAYSAEEILPVVVALPEGASVTYSERPFNVGTYSVTVTISKAGYRDRVFECQVIIEKATPTVVFNAVRNIPYDVRYVLSGADVNGYAHLSGATVEGEFHFNKTSGLGDKETLRYGEYTYSVGFTPVSSNFNAIESVDYVMKTYVSADSYSLTAMGESLIDTLVSDDDITVSLVTDESLTGALHLLIDGSNVYYTDTPNVYVFTESVEDVLIDVMISNVSIYSITVDIVINRPVDEPETPDIPSGDENESGSGENGGNIQGGSGEGSTVKPENNSTPSEETSNTGLIIGLSVGGGAVVIILIVVLVVVLKKKE